jgi:hypothetical protein
MRGASDTPLVTLQGYIVCAPEESPAEEPERADLSVASGTFLAPATAKFLLG